MKNVTISKVLTASAVALSVSFGAAAQEPKDGSFDSLNGVAPNGGVVGATYAVSDSAGAQCAFNYIDITGSGANVFSGDDVASAPIAAGGSGVELFDASFGSVVMASNGYLTTDLADTGPDLSNDCPLPAVPSTPAGTAGIRVYPMHDDLISDGYYEYFGNCPRPSDQQPGSGAGCHVFQWDNVTHFGGAEAPWGFETIIYEGTGEIVVQHLAGNPEEGSGSTTGIQNGTFTDATTYACDTAMSVAPSTAQCFYNPPPFIVPTLNSIGLWVLMALGLLAGFVTLRRRESES